MIADKVQKLPHAKRLKIRTSDNASIGISRHLLSNVGFGQISTLILAIVSWFYCSGDVIAVIFVVQGFME